MIGTVQLALFMFLVGFRFLCTYIFHFTMICLLRQSIASTKSPSIPPHAARDLDGCIYTCIERKRERERERELCYIPSKSNHVKPHRLWWSLTACELPGICFRIQFPSLGLWQEQQLAGDLQADSAAICICVLPHAFQLEHPLFGLLSPPHPMWWPSKLPVLQHFDTWPSYLNLAIWLLRWSQNQQNVAKPYVIHLFQPVSTVSFPNMIYTYTFVISYFLFSCLVLSHLIYATVSICIWSFCRWSCCFLLLFVHFCPLTYLCTGPRPTLRDWGSSPSYPGSSYPCLNVSLS